MDRIKGGIDLRFVGNIAIERMAVVDFSLQGLQALGIARQHRDTIVAGGKAAAERRAGTGAYASDQCDRLRHVLAACAGPDPICLTRHASFQGGIQTLGHIRHS